MFDDATTCTQRDDDGCATYPSPALGRCPACQYVFHDIPLSSDEAHGELCCGQAGTCGGAWAGICATHPEPTIPSVVDGPILPEHMCPGSEGRQVMFRGSELQCSTCNRWLPAYPGSFLAPVHRLPEQAEPEAGAWLKDAYGVAYWSPTGEAGTWGIGDDGQPSFVPACHQGCSMCWFDFLADRPTDHACTCDACTPRLPEDHRWWDGCSCSSCLPE